MTKKRDEKAYFLRQVRADMTSRDGFRWKTRGVSLGASGAVIGGTATAGDGGTATAGDGGTATAGNEGTATAGDEGTATAGDGGEIRIRWWDGRASRYRVAVGYVGEDGILPRVAYVVRDGRLVAAEQS